MSFFAGRMMMAAAARGGGLPGLVASSIQSADNNVTLTVDKPAGTLSGDFMVAFVWGNNMSDMTLTGWTRVFINTVGSLDLAVFTKTAGGSEPSSYSFDQTGGARSCVMATYRGVAGAIDVQSTGTNAANDATATALSITPTKPGLLLASFGLRTLGTVSSPPAGMSYVNGLSATVSMALYELSPSSAGATGNKSLTWSSSTNSGGWMAQIY